MERPTPWSLETGGSRADHAARALVLKKRDDAEADRHPLLLQRDVSHEFSLSVSRAADTATLARGLRAASSTARLLHGARQLKRNGFDRLIRLALGMEGRKT